MATIKINVFRDAGTWYGARWIDGKYDGCNSLDVSSERDALEAARCLSLACAGERIVVLVQSSNAAPRDLRYNAGTNPMRSCCSLLRRTLPAGWSVAASVRTEQTPSNRTRRSSREKEVYEFWPFVSAVCPPWNNR